MRTVYIAAIGLFVTGILSAATITTSTSCRFYGQPTILDPSSCSIVQSLSIPPNRAQGRANSSVNYGIGGNILTVWFEQGVEITGGDYTAAEFFSSDYPDLLQGSVTASGSIGLEIQSAGSGTGVLRLAGLSLPSRDEAGEDDSAISFTVAGSDFSCSDRLPPFGCDFQPAGIPFEMGSLFAFDASESSFAFVDYVNPLSSVFGATELQFLFTDANGYPVDISEAPEPGTIGLVLMGALLAALLVFARRALERS
ncbi:MAG: hypothetical protein ACRD4O_18710 [Bryobacteraceae bacterium]